MIYDGLSRENAENLAASMPSILKEKFGTEAQGTVFTPVTELAQAVGESDVIITVTPSRQPLIKKEWVKPGTHFSCIGADMEGKEEIDPHLFSGARVFADDLGQCARVGEMELAIKSGLFSETAAVGEIGQVLLGEIAGRRSGEEITIFDATGLAALDLVTGKRAVDLARVKGIGMTAEI